MKVSPFRDDYFQLLFVISWHWLSSILEIGYEIKNIAATIGKDISKGRQEYLLKLNSVLYVEISRMKMRCIYIMGYH